MKILIDANVILRYLLNDIEVQATIAKDIIDNGACTIPEVIAEVVYVLSGVYKVGRDEISEVLIDFLTEIELNNKVIICEALRIYSNTSIDYVDCVLHARNKVLNQRVYTFDKKLNNNLNK